MLRFDDVYHLQKIMEAPAGSPRLLGYVEWYGDRTEITKRVQSEWAFGVYKGRPYTVVVECFDFDGTTFPGLFGNQLFVGRVWEEETAVHLFYTKEYFNARHPFLVTFDNVGRHRVSDNRHPDILKFNVRHQFARFRRWLKLGFK